MIFDKIGLKFDTRARPELQRAIVERLTQLGCRMDAHSGIDSYTNNVTLNWRDHTLHKGSCPMNWSEFAELRLTTLEDLYDIDSWLPKTYTIIIDGKEIVLSEESYETMKASLT